MNSIFEWSKRLRSAALGAAAGFIDSSSIIGDRLRLGITSRLVLAFVGVAALVLAANFIVAREVLIERTTEITRMLRVPVPAIPAPVGSHAPDEIPQLERVPIERRVVNSDGVLLAVDHLGVSLQERVRVKNDVTDARYRNAATELKRASTAFITTAGSISGQSFGRLDAALKSYVKGGETWIAGSDRRRELAQSYNAVLEELNARVKASLESSWKIFGRVLAKQSLMQLSNDLDSLRHHALSVSSSETVDPPAIATLLEAEAVVGKDVANNRASLQRSEGTAWFEAMHADLVTLAALRTSITTTQEQLAKSAQEVAAQAAALTKLIPAKVESAPDPAMPRSSKKTLQTTEPMAAAATSPTIQTHQTSSESPQTQRRRLELAWISVGAVLLLIYIAAGTVLSIVRPVRRLVRASARLAKGDTSVRVQRGGINELDIVAVAFNAMAEELAIARASMQEHQHGLELKVAERTRQLQALAERDPLTDLPNRRQFFQLLRQAISQAELERKQVGVFFLDIDNFKNINDGMGHTFGDRVLVSLAERLRTTVESFAFAARVGGDEFTVVFPNCSTVDVIRAAGTKIVQAFQTPLTVDDRDIIVSVSVGASIYPDHEHGAEALLKAADAALFRAKALGRSQLSVFTPELLEAAAAKFLTEQGLRRALTRGEFELAFQPEVCAETLQTTLVEALIRWRMPDGSLAGPDHFLAIAEESGLIMEIGDWVIKSAVEAAAHWHHGVWPEARVAINVVPRQLADPIFVERLIDLMKLHRLPSRCIEIELTESVLQTGPSTIDALRRLRAHGIDIALDDFGTGYSSLASLEQLPLTRIKLDRSLIASIDSSPRSHAIARAIIGMCQSLGLEITAEGIERPDQFAMLIGVRGMHLQGYLLARPAPREELVALLGLVTQHAQGLVLESRQATAAVARIVCSSTDSSPADPVGSRLLTSVGRSR